MPWGRSSISKKTLQIGIPYTIDPERPPSVSRKEKTYWLHPSDNYSGCHRKPALEMEAYPEQSVTYSGGRINLHVKINNFSGKTITQLKIKLKRKITYGSSHEKQTVMKCKHIDKQFPLGQGIFNGFIPIIIPNLDNKPTLVNGTLGTVHYFLSVRAKIHVGIDQRLHVPITVASFPPSVLEKFQPSLEDSRERESEGTTEKKDHVITFDWDAPLEDGQRMGTPLQPRKNESEMDDEKLSPFEMEYQQIQSQFLHLIGEIDTLTQFASTGQLNEVCLIYFANLI